MPSSDSNNKKSILFVCMGNICRSPAAESVMRKLVEDEGLQGFIECDSAGTIDLHEGNPPDARMRRAGAMRGVAVKGAARQVRSEDFGNFDRILVMDEENMCDLRAFDRNGAAGDRLRFFCDYCSEHTVREVPDPYYGGDDGFEMVLDLLQDGCQALLSELKTELEAGTA